MEGSTNLSVLSIFDDIYKCKPVIFFPFQAVKGGGFDMELAKSSQAVDEMPIRDDSSESVRQHTDKQNTPKSGTSTSI